MKIVTGYNDLCDAIARVSAVFTDKTLAEDLRTVLFVVKNNTVSLCAGAQEIGCKTVLPTMSVDCAETEKIICITVKSLQSRLSGFSSLGVTKVDSVTIEYDDTTQSAVIKFAEVAKDDKSAYAAQYAKTTVYAIECTIVQKYQLQMLDTLHKQETTDEGTDVECSLVSTYLDAILPVLPKDVTDNQATRITISDKYVYAVPKVFALLMANNLPECFNNVVLRRTTAQFIQHFCTLSEQIKVHQWIPEGATADSVVVQLTLRNADTVAVARAITAKVKYDITDYMTVPSNAVTVERRYLMDVLRRISIAGNEVIVTFSCDEDCGVVTFDSKQGYESVPVVGRVGKGTYSFEMSPDRLQMYTMAHLKGDTEYAYIFAETDEQGRITLACSDSSSEWHTMVRRLSASGGDFGWKSRL